MLGIDLADYLLIAEAVLGHPAEDLGRYTRISSAESALAAPFATFDGVEFYDDLATKAAVLCSRLVRNHPLPDGNKRAALLSMLEFVARNGGAWQEPSQDEIGDVIEALAAGELSEPDFIEWVRWRVAAP